MRVNAAAMEVGNGEKVQRKSASHYMNGENELDCFSQGRYCCGRVQRANTSHSSSDRSTPHSAPYQMPKTVKAQSAVCVFRSKQTATVQLDRTANKTHGDS